MLKAIKLLVFFLLLAYASGLFGWYLGAFVEWAFYEEHPKPIERDICQKHFKVPNKNTTLYDQKNIPHKGIKPARVVIECEVK